MTDIVLGGATSVGFMNSNIISEQEINDVKNKNETMAQWVFDTLSDCFLGTHRAEAKQAIRELIALDGQEVEFSEFNKLWMVLVDCTRDPATEADSLFASDLSDNYYLGRLDCGIDGRSLNPATSDICLQFSLQFTQGDNVRVNLVNTETPIAQTITVQPYRPEPMVAEMMYSSDIEDEISDITPGGPSFNSSVFSSEMTHNSLRQNLMHAEFQDGYQETVIKHDGQSMGVNSFFIDDGEYDSDVDDVPDPSKMQR